MAKFCTKCGNQISDEAQFCRFCGAKINESQAQEHYEEPPVSDHYDEPRVIDDYQEPIQDLPEEVVVERHEPKFVEPMPDPAAGKARGNTGLGDTMTAGNKKVLIIAAAAVLIAAIIGVVVVVLNLHKSEPRTDAQTDTQTEAQTETPAGADSGAKSAIPGAALEYSGHHYMIYNDSLTWAEAEEKCEDMGGHLVTITDENEYRFVVNAIEEDGTQKWHYWLGATDTAQEGDWRWVTGEALREGFTKWDLTSNQPNNKKKTDPNGENYLEMQTTRPESHPQEYMTWNDICNDGVAFGYEEDPEYCSKKYFGYICEWDE